MTGASDLDDAHVADVESLRTLASALRHHPEAGLRVVATATTGDRRTDAEVLDLLPRFQGMDERELVVCPTDHHPNARAHAIARGWELDITHARGLFGYWGIYFGFLGNPFFSNVWAWGT